MYTLKKKILRRAIVSTGGGRISTERPFPHPQGGGGGKVHRRRSQAPSPPRLPPGGSGPPGAPDGANDRRHAGVDILNIETVERRLSPPPFSAPGRGTPGGGRGRPARRGGAVTSGAGCPARSVPRRNDWRLIKFSVSDKKCPSSASGGGGCPTWRLAPRENGRD